MIFREASQMRPASKVNLPKISRFHHIPGSGTNGQHFLKIFLSSLGFAYDFAFCQNIGLSRIIPRKNTKNPINRQNFLKRIPEIWYKKYGGVIGQKNVEILEFQKVEMCQHNEFLKWFPIFLIFFEIFPWEIRGVRAHYGSKKLKKKEVLKSIQKVLESIRNR